MARVTYSIVVPVYNSEKSLEQLYARLNQVFQHDLQQSFELILVDDGSSDGSWEVMRKLRACDPNVKIIRLTGNVGQHYALLCGFRFCCGQWIITMDDDLQNPPEEIPKLIRKMSEGFDLIIGIQEKKHHSWYRNLGTHLMDQLNNWIFQKPRDLKFSNFKLFTRDALQAMIANLTPNYVYLAAAILQGLPHDRIANVTVKHSHRQYGHSQYSMLKLFSLSSNLLINHSVIPLRAGIYLGLAISVMCLMFTGFVLLRVLLYGPIKVVGWASLIVFITFLFGILFIFLGIIGEYLYRILRSIHAPELHYPLIREAEGLSASGEDSVSEQQDFAKTQL